MSETNQAVETAAVENKQKKGKKKEKKTVGQEILSWVLTILVAVVAALVIRSLVFEPVRVDGESMDDTLANGEIMFVSKYDYSSTWLCLPWQSNTDKENAPRFTFGGNPQRFDVVICRYPGRGDTNFVKRVVGLPGDTIRLEDGYLYVKERVRTRKSGMKNPISMMSIAREAGILSDPMRFPKDSISSWAITGTTPMTAAMWAPSAGI